MVPVWKRIAEVLPSVRSPAPYDKVYKEECMFSFDTPLSKEGLYLNLSTLQSFGQDFVEVDFQRSKFPLYLHMKWTKVPLAEEERKKTEEKPTKMAIGVEGGFQVDKEKYKTEASYSLVLFPEKTVVSLESPEVPTELSLAIMKIQEHADATVRQESFAWEEQKVISKYAENLEQLESEKKDLSNPELWVCAESGMKENLWLNLSTGYIGSGRAWWSGGGGTGAALHHYQETGSRYPIAVKLGTITPTEADVYSYAPDEDEMVIDPYLEKHLQFWGIEMKNMEKTVKTTSELQVEINQNFEFNKITEASSTLVPMSGPCYIGLKNFGNSCYVNAVMEIIWMIPIVRERYLTDVDHTFLTADADPSLDFPTQMAKLGMALVGGRTGHEKEDDNANEAVKPFFFKWLVGQGHSEFSTNHQQDTAQYLMHLLEIMDRSENSMKERFVAQRNLSFTSSMFAFELEDRILCNESKRVRYRTSQALMLELRIPLEMATNKKEVDCYKERELKRQKLRESGADVEISIESVENGVTQLSEITKDDKEEKILPIVPFSACLEQFIGETILEDYNCEFLKHKTQAFKSTKMKTFPPFLMVSLQRYYMEERWQPRKLEVLVTPPDELNLEQIRAAGPQENELLQPEVEKTNNTGPLPNPNIVEQLTAMGFSSNGARRAAVAVSNRSTQEAMEWVLAHMEDSDFDHPIESENNVEEISQDSLQILEAMGFTDDMAKAALIKFKGKVEEGADWLLRNTSQLDMLVPQILNAHSTAKGSGSKQFLDGEGTYHLVGFISHMGSSTACGHYVCHIKKKGKWILFNDEKVAISETPPTDLGYMYLYRRSDIDGVDE